MTRINGYYDKNSCIAGYNYEYLFLDQGQEETGAAPECLVTEIDVAIREETETGILNRKGTAAIFWKPIKSDPVPEDIADKLTRSGHYFWDVDGTLRSSYLSSILSFVGCVDFLISPLVVGTIDDIEVTEELTFGSCLELSVDHGLIQNVRIEKKGLPPVYVVDHHNLAYFAWEEAYFLGYIQRGATLIHIDRHPDDGGRKLRPSYFNDFETAVDFIINETGWAGFIAPAVIEGLVATSWFFELAPGYVRYYEEFVPGERVDQVSGHIAFTRALFRYEAGLDPLSFEVILEKFSPSREIQIDSLDFEDNPKKYILDIDLDGLVADDYRVIIDPNSEPLASNLKALAALAKKAGVVTIATSPGYTNQEKAVEVARLLVNAILEQ